MLTGCGGSQPPIRVPGAMPQTSAIAARADRGKSWMDRAAYRQDLLYVVSYANNDVNVYTYPQGHRVGTLTGFITPLGECVDPAGDVFIAAAANQERTSGIIYEYAHGGTSPVAMLKDANPAFGCAVDPQSGNLAVTGGGVAVYTHASGQPVLYDSSQPTYFCGYDNEGNLYVSDTTERGPEQLVKLAKGSSTLEPISLDVSLYGTVLIPPSVQWDGKHMTVSSAAQKVEVGYDGPISLYRLHISGDSATVIGTTTLSSKKNVRRTGQILIQGKRVLGSDYYRHSGGVDSWSYPNAGKPRSIVLNRGEVDPFGIVVSPAVSHQGVF
jgi:hypothetical protein